MLFSTKPVLFVHLWKSPSRYFSWMLNILYNPLRLLKTSLKFYISAKNKVTAIATDYNFRDSVVSCHTHQKFQAPETNTSFFFFFVSVLIVIFIICLYFSMNQIFNIISSRHQSWWIILSKIPYLISFYHLYHYLCITS